jgi:hypothetical protein
MLPATPTAHSPGPENFSSPPPLSSTSDYRRTERVNGSQRFSAGRRQLRSRPKSTNLMRTTRPSPLPSSSFVASSFVAHPASVALFEAAAPSTLRISQPNPGTTLQCCPAQHPPCRRRRPAPSRLCSPPPPKRRRSMRGNRGVPPSYPSRSPHPPIQATFARARRICLRPRRCQRRRTRMRPHRRDRGCVTCARGGRGVSFYQIGPSAMGGPPDPLLGLRRGGRVRGPECGAHAVCGGRAICSGRAAPGEDDLGMDTRWFAAKHASPTVVRRVLGLVAGPPGVAGVGMFLRCADPT